MAEEEKSAAEKRRTIYLNRLTMYGQSPDGNDRNAPRIYWALFDGNPRLEVRTNVEADQQKELRTYY